MRGDKWFVPQPRYFVRKLGGGIFRNAYTRNGGLRIDHFLLSSHLSKRLRKAEVNRHVRGWEKTSDHAPVWIELKD